MDSGLGPLPIFTLGGPGTTVPMVHVGTWAAYRFAIVGFARAGGGP